MLHSQFQHSTSVRQKELPQQVMCNAISLHGNNWPPRQLNITSSFFRASSAFAISISSRRRSRS